jgi:acylglycerol lipase
MRTEITASHVHDGETFRLRGWASPTPTRTAIVIHHGLGEHGGRYASFVRHLDDLPAHIWTYDLRGHGESTGKRGDADGFEQLAADFEALLPVLLAKAGLAEDGRVLLFGHSLGAAALGWYLTTRTPHRAIAAVTLSAPPVVIPQSFTLRLKGLFARAIVRVAPRLTLSNEIDPDVISSDPAEVARYRDDPLIHDRLSVRLGLSLLDDAPLIVARAGRITLPALLWHGVDDRLVDIRGSRELFRAVGSSDKVLIELPGYRHESHHERPELATALFERYRTWLGPRIVS